MFAWLAGRPVEDGTGDNVEIEPPETPAPLFAARAIRSAIFGTPKPVEADETTITEEMRKGSLQTATDCSSPIKPPGILITPGLPKSARKSVTFGKTVVEKTSKHAVGRSGIPHDCPGKFPSPWTPKVNDLPNTRRTSLTRSLEDARNEASATKRRSLERRLEQPDQKATEVAHIKTTSKPTSISISKSRDHEQKSAALANDVDADTTLDLNHPHSHSGKYWKSEYERYHEEAKSEMKRLLKYKEMAKSFATRKDSEAADLRSRLLEEQDKVTLMEDRMKSLAAEIVDSRVNGNKDNLVTLTEELSRQTTLAVRYRDEVDRFRQLLDGREKSDPRSDAEVGNGASPKTAATLVEVGSELRRAREQVKEMHTLQVEMHAMKMNLSMAEKRASRLSQENAMLSRDLAEVRSCLARSEHRRQSAEQRASEHEQRSSEVARSYESVKSFSETQKQNGNGKLEQRRYQPNVMEQEASTCERPLLQDLKQVTIMGAQQRSTIALSEHFSDFADSKECPHEIADGMRFRIDEIQQAQQKSPAIPEHHTKPGPSLPNRKVSSEFRESAENHKIGVPKTTAGQNGMPSLSAALSEIPDNGQIARQASLIDRESIDNFDRPVEDPRSILPPTRLPYSELPPVHLEDDVKAARKARPSPGPSMINFYPQKQMPRISATSTTSQNTNNNAACGRHSSMSSLRSRASLPPHRAAAAKARLAQRNVEKKRAKEEAALKENTRVASA